MLPVVLLILCVVLRVLPHPPNFAPQGAACVFAGRTLPRQWAIVFALASMFLADLALAKVHNYPLFTWATPFVYIGFAIQTLLGAQWRRKRGGALLAASSGTLIFFVLSNFGVWVSGWYGHTTVGLITCYVAALPFLAMSLGADLLWTVILTRGYRQLARIGNMSQNKFWVPVGEEAR